MLGQALIATPISAPGRSALGFIFPKECIDEDGTVYDNQQKRERYAQRVTDAAIPSYISHQAKCEIEADLIEQAVDADFEHSRVLGDAKFGRRLSFRERLRELGDPYVLALETWDCISLLNPHRFSSLIQRTNEVHHTGITLFRTISTQKQLQTSPSSLGMRTGQK